MHLSIVIPTFNERENVRAITRRIHEALRGVDEPYEIWFIDDSRDDTPQVLAELARSDPRVHYVHREGGRGLATAVVEGFRRSRGRYIVVMDADLQHPPELLPTILHRLNEGIDIVIPSRFVPGGSDGGLNWFRKWVSWTARTIGRLAVRRLRGISDCTGGYFGLRREVIDGVELDPIGWKILMEVLVKGRYETVHEIPYAFEAREAGESKMSLVEQWNYLRHVARLVWSSPEDRRFYVYCMVGSLGVVVNTAVMSILLYGLHLHATLASVIASLVAMAHNFLWNDRVTWRAHAHPVRWRRALQAPLFALVSASGIAVTALFVQLFLWLHWPPLVGQWTGIVVATGWTFTANNRWTWTPHDEDGRQVRRQRVRITHE
ncbi:glycosyltransferase [Alicyclobacillus macrosporangiidus]|uniref:glycosyltransferase n=1 Tax=Alicyclobacillus macrosporangiidus TaxID=392015 RepID=UPI00049588DB|nr:glycosyltransferase family 2 protein [Alicyclobacillus macrosporangiidus]